MLPNQMLLSNKSGGVRKSYFNYAEVSAWTRVEQQLNTELFTNCFGNFSGLLLVHIQGSQTPFVFICVIQYQIYAQTKRDTS